MECKSYYYAPLRDRCYQIHEKIIDNIMNLNSNDKTEIWKNDENSEESEITNGIRQRCTGSRIIPS